MLGRICVIKNNYPLSAGRGPSHWRHGNHSDDSCASISFSFLSNYYILPGQVDPSRLIGLPRNRIIGASCCRRLKGKGGVPSTLARFTGKGASALFSYAPRWLQTTELNQLKFNPEPGSGEAAPSSTFPASTTLPSFSPFSLFSPLFSVLSLVPLFHPLSTLSSSTLLFLLSARFHIPLCRSLSLVLSGHSIRSSLLERAACEYALPRSAVPFYDLAARLPAQCCRRSDSRGVRRD